MSSTRYYSRVLFFSKILFIGLASLMCLHFHLLYVFAAPYAGDHFSFTQPDQSKVEVALWGDEFYMRAESLDGYTLTADSETGWIYYAKLAADGSEFVPTEFKYRGGIPPTWISQNIPKHLSLPSEVISQKVDSKYQLWQKQLVGGREGVILVSVYNPSPKIHFLDPGGVAAFHCDFNNYNFYTYAKVELYQGPGPEPKLIKEIFDNYKIYNYRIYKGSVHYWQVSNDLSGTYFRLKITALHDPLTYGYSNYFIIKEPDEIIKEPDEQSEMSTIIKGITLLIDFPDPNNPGVNKSDPNIIGEIRNFLNQKDYKGYGCNGSVRDYFYEVSGGKIEYTNDGPYFYMAKHNKTYYDDIKLNWGIRGEELVREALVYLDNTIDFSTLYTNEDKRVLAVNAFYIGYPRMWRKGLFPHCNYLDQNFSADGVGFNKYQITNVGNDLDLAIFCHENGHMLFDWPDLYDYGHDGYPSQGIGAYGIMGSGVNKDNPAPPCAYLRYLAGWETITDISYISDFSTEPSFDLPANSLESYRYSNPKDPNEYFLIECRVKGGRNEHLPDEGLMIWHIDENVVGDFVNEHQNMTCTQHYKVSLEQSDGLFDLETVYRLVHNPTRYIFLTNIVYNFSLPDLFSEDANKNEFSSTTTPNSDWWCDGKSNFVIKDISVVKDVMSFTLGKPPSVYKPNLTPCKPGGWDDKIVVSNQTDGTYADDIIKIGQAAYIDYAIMNDSDVDIYSDFDIHLVIDGDIVANLSPSLNNLDPYWMSQSQYTFETEGSHNIQLICDVNDDVDESNEEDNEYIKRIFVYDDQKPNIEVFLSESRVEECDFGKHPKGGTIPTRYVLTISNSQFVKANLDISAISLNQGEDNFDLHFDKSFYNPLGTPPSSLSAGQKANFIVDFLPLSEGQKSAIISIMSNDPDTPVYEILLKGYGHDEKDISLNLRPDSTELYIGDIFRVLCSITNHTNEKKHISFVTAVLLPSGDFFGPLYGPSQLHLNPGETISGYLQLTIPNGAPLGTFIYFGNVTLDYVVAQDEFDFEIFEGQPPGEMNSWFQKEECNYEISSNSISIDHNGGKGSINVTAPFGCSWYADSNDSWIEISLENSSGTGNGIVDYEVKYNSESERKGKIIIAGKTIIVTQQGKPIWDTVYDYGSSGGYYGLYGGSGIYGGYGITSWGGLYGSSALYGGSGPDINTGPGGSQGSIVSPQYTFRPISYGSYLLGGLGMGYGGYNYGLGYGGIGNYGLSYYGAASGYGLGYGGYNYGLGFGGIGNFGLSYYGAASNYGLGYGGYNYGMIGISSYNYYKTLINP